MTSVEHQRITLCRIILILGVAAGVLSMWKTLAFSWNPLFEAPRLPEGPTHTNYHAFREFTLSTGAYLTILYAMFQPAPRRTTQLWIMMLVVALGYYAGWWLPWPLLDLHHPNAVAGTDHILTTVLVLTAIGLSRPAFTTSRAAQTAALPASRLVS